MDILDQIEKQYVSFSNKEKQIAMYILQNSNSIKNINISKLAEKTQTSSATITRFCRKISCDSFVDMKIKISASQVDSQSRETGNIYEDVYQFYDKVIERTKKNIDTEVVQKFVEEIKKVKRIFIYGVGSSGITGLELQQRFIRMGLNITCVTDSHMMLINSTLVTKDDLVLGISTSGTTQDIIKALKIVKSKGAKIACITSFSESPLAKLSDYVMTVYNSLFVDDTRFVNSQFAIVYLMDVISTMLLEEEGYHYMMSQTINAIVKDGEE
ncbi:MurR/RpiR family transcriptional regulator [Granulicatella seriolae]|uniref:MurR/RpiR family transcriptional regulator n=1 Tax=Granulicatella seriolae TaxID=2967226 RepID=A0ABT1WLS3_9LACT|nr:MurR/RpiR family transcriptional regulator [Granulicatella seriolae]